MDTSYRIIVTGAAGFIGSCMVQTLNDLGYSDLILVDNFGDEAKKANWETKKFTETVEKELLEDWLSTHRDIPVKCIIHMGANSSTTEFNYDILKKWNLEYTQMLWLYATAHQIPLIYASSAATYGDGSLGYDDNHKLPFELKPLNPYGVSKNEFDKWALQETAQPTFWAGLKFFNVYGPNEWHKGRMASVVLHAFNQIKASGTVKLFKSYRPDFKDGEQKRDFVYVKDLTKVMVWMMQSAFDGVTVPSGLYNIGAGQARTFHDLVAATFKALGLEPNIEFIDMPVDIRDKYQYYTEANISKLRASGYLDPVYSLEEGVADYVQNYLSTGKHF